jgi:putative colanic acid biosynthesis glycosyltransferase
MVVYQINVEANYGSTGKIAEALGTMVQEKGGTAFLAHGRKYRDSLLNTYKVGNLWSFGFHFMLSRLFDGQGRGSYFATKRLVNHLKKTNPDIIHLHNIHGYFINYTILFAFLAEFKGGIVWTLHDCWAFTGHCTHFEPHACEKWKTQCQKCPALQDYPKSHLVDNSRANFKKKKETINVVEQMHMVPVSNWLGKHLASSFLSTKKATVIKNGINLRLFKPSKGVAMYPDKKIILGVASVWDKNKGLYDFVEMQELLKDDELIILVGLNEKQIQELPKEIIGIARTSDLNELITLYSSAACYMNLTHADSYPTTIMEAMACGTPVITYRTGGCTEMVQNSGVGAVIEKKNYKEALKEFRSMLNGISPEDRANKSRNHALLYFNGKNQLKAYEKLYSQISPKQQK